MTDSTPVNISLPQWREKSLVRKMTISATQLETHALCRRKWWLDNVRKLTVLQKTPQTFGDCLHAVIQRYLMADDLGRDPATGLAVDLYPPGWDKAVSRYDGKVSGTINAAEQDLIKKLIARAIEEGILERQPGREIEKQFWLPVIDGDGGCPKCEGKGGHDSLEDGAFIKCDRCGGDGRGVTVSSTGFIDERYPAKVCDQKSTSSMRWAKSPAKLKQTPQMMLYGQVLVHDIRKRGEPMPREFTLRHNYYCKDPHDMRVRKVEATVTAAELDAYWTQKVLPAAADMVQLRRNTEKWHDIPDPPSISESCNAYGGCPFQTICRGQESEENYQKRVDLALASNYSVKTVVQNVSATPESKGSQMASPFAARIAQRQASTTAAAAGTAAPAQVNAPAPAPAAAAPAPVAGKVNVFNRTPAAPAAPAAAPASAPAPAPAGATAFGGDGKPPWATAGCPGCKGSGFNKEGAPCRLCVVKAKQSGVPGPDAFEIVVPGDGTVVWMATDGSSEGTHVIAAPAAEVKAAAVVEQPKPHPTPAAVAAAPSAPAPSAKTSDTPAPNDDSAPAPATVTAKGSPGRPREGFCLFVNCAPVRTPGGKSAKKTIFLSSVLLNIGKQLVEANNATPGATQVETFADLNVFQRRDSITGNGDAIAAEFGTDDVVADGVTAAASDMKTLLDAIRPYATKEVHPLGA